MQIDLLDLLIKKYHSLEQCRNDIMCGYKLMESAYSENKKLLIAGNGGSASDAEHIVGELMKGFKMRREISTSLAQRLTEIDAIMGAKLAEKLEYGLPAISLSAHESLFTAYINDVEASSVFAQQVLGFGKNGDVLLAISTSGNSKNILEAAVVAKALGLKILGLTGKTGGELVKFCDVTVKVPEIETYKIQELHLPIYHYWCLMLEERFFTHVRERG